MSDVLATHNKAMEWADEGQLSRNRGDHSGARVAFHKAMTLEREAAYAVGDTEPDRSVLFRSAGSLALECDEVRTAERLFAMGLAGDAPEEIAEEIRDLLEQVHFRRHLDLSSGSTDSQQKKMWTGSPYRERGEDLWMVKIDCWDVDVHPEIGDSVTVKGRSGGVWETKIVAIRSCSDRSARAVTEPPPWAETQLMDARAEAARTERIASGQVRARVRRARRLDELDAIRRKHGVLPTRN